MTILLIILIFLCFYKSKSYIFSNNFNTLYLSKDTTTSIKGIFVLLVFFSHLKQYISFDSIFDKGYVLLQDYLGQLIVCVFLFYSGYGIFESFKKKGKNYIEKLPKSRILKTLVHFQIAIIVYLILNLIVGNNYSIVKKLLSFIAWESIGNSNWFVFTILCCYSSTYFSFKILKKEKSAILCNFILIFGICIFLFKFQESWWYDTIFCYPFGIFYSYFKQKIEKNLLKTNLRYYIFSIITIFLFVLLYQINQIYIYEVVGILFCLLIILFSLKININNKILIWFGNNVFSVYILQRIPMIVLSKYFTLPKYTFIIVSFIATIIISIMFDKLLFQIDNRIFKKEVKL